MDRFDITGRRPLVGAVRVAGAKNAALPAMAAALLSDQPSRIAGVPWVRDVETMRRLLGTLGVDGVRDGDAVVLTPQGGAPNCAADYQLVRRMRASVCVLGPLVGRRGRARVALPGGCQIGHRPIDRHLDALARLGADIRLERGDVVAEASRLVGCDLDLAGPRGSTVTGTGNAVAAATLARGRTVIRGAAVEPEVADLCRALRTMGARIDGIGHDTLTIDGVEELGGLDHRIIPDRIEAATLAAAAAMVPGSGVTIEGVVPEHVAAPARLLTACGLSSAFDRDRWTVRRDGPLTAIDLEATPYPGPPTDWQAQFTAVMTQADGPALIRDAVFPDRFGHAGELVRLGAAIERTADGLRVGGPSPLVGCDVLACDLRASAALVLAGLAAEGTTRVRRIYHLDRGYESLESKLTALGADVRRVRDEHPF